MRGGGRELPPSSPFSSAKLFLLLLIALLWKFLHDGGGGAGSGVTTVRKLKPNRMLKKEERGGRGVTDLGFFEFLHPVACCGVPVCPQPTLSTRFASAACFMSAQPISIACIE